MTVGSYVLARFADPEKLLPAMQKVQSCEPVVRWHAVDGHVHLVMKVATPATALPEPLKRLDGAHLTTYDIVLDEESNRAIDPAMAHAYLFLEVEPAKLDAARAALRKLPEVVFCSTTRGGCDLVALVAGPNFDSLDYFINDNIQMLDGLLRLKHDYVIELTTL